MDPQNPVKNYVVEQNKLRLKNGRIIAGIKGLNAFLIGASSTLAGLLLFGFGITEALAIFLLVGLSAAYLLWRRTDSLKTIRVSDMYAHLEANFPDAGSYPSSLEGPTSLPPHIIDNIKAQLDQERLSFNAIESTRFKVPLTTLVILLTTTGLFYSLTAAQLHARVDEAFKIAAAIGRENVLEIVEGLAVSSDASVLELNSGYTAYVSLLPTNLVTVKVSLPFSKKLPSLQLKRIDPNPQNQPDERVDQNKKPKGSDRAPNDEIMQVFQMSPVRHPKTGMVIDHYYTLTFSAESSTEVYVPELDSDTPLVSIDVKELPVPKLKLTWVTDQKGDDMLWSDDEPLDLLIEVDAKFPLRKIDLKITINGKSSEELVANILNNTQLQYEDYYQLLLEPYLDEDIAEVEIIASAVDQATPEPLVGFSNPVFVKVASAYGRYKDTLQQLRVVKEELDQSKAEATYNSLSPDGAKTLDSALKASEKTAFFDAIDRLTIRSLGSRIKQLAEIPSENKGRARQLVAASSALDDFLSEHEALDDRERDRDFFVAIRSLSRVLEKDKNRRQLEVGYVTEKMRAFLATRRQRWALRLQRIPDDLKPLNHKSIVELRPFSEDLTQIDRLEKDVQTSNPESLILLSKLAPKYRSWIEALEQAEDLARERLKQERQQSLNQAENKLKQLQKEQSRVSALLDKATKRETSDLQKAWTTARTLETAIISQTSQMATQMKAVAPEAAERIEAAAEAMSQTIAAGDSEKFVAAESASDLAGRLLRNAQQKANEEKRRSQGNSNQRQRRRTGSGDYYGKTVIGGDVAIERTYEVDKRYREAILDDVRSYKATPEERKVLNKYLRETVR